LGEVCGFSIIINITEKPQTSPKKFHNPLMDNEMGNIKVGITDNEGIKMLQ
jgi:hypothetical protein